MIGKNCMKRQWSNDLAMRMEFSTIAVIKEVVMRKVTRKPGFLTVKEW